MEFGSRDYSKADYARTLAASLGYFLLQQRDMVGLALFADGLQQHLPPRWRPGHLRRMLAALDRAPEGTTTRLGQALEDVSRLWRKRGLIVLISDLLAPVEEWDSALGRLAAVGHDVRVLQVLDPAELTLEYGHAAEWEDLESGQRLYLDPRQARASYRERFQSHQRAVRRALDHRGIPLHVAPTDRPFDFVLLEWIQRSGGGRRSTFRTRRK